VAGSGSGTALRTMDPMCTRVEQLIPNVRRLGMRRQRRFLTRRSESGASGVVKK